MKPDGITDCEIDKAFSLWEIPRFPSDIGDLPWGGGKLEHARQLLAKMLRSARFADNISELEQTVSKWLYNLVRENVKRGRRFLLEDVLAKKQADCLGYAKLLRCLGEWLGLDIGVVEVIIDNRGRYVPHCANLVKFPPGGWRFIDLWYGAINIRHRRLGLQVKQRDEWKIEDMDWDELERTEGIRGLPKACVDGITYYVLGNRHLEQEIRSTSRRELDVAIEHYDRTLKLYPGYARAYFNRAIARENKGEYEKARLDYAQALRDESNQIRVLAREHEDVIQLMELDTKGIEPREQQIYLLSKGFITGEEVSPAYIARQFRISKPEVDRILSAIEAELARH